MEVRRQYGPSGADGRLRVEWTIWEGLTFGAYSRSWTGAHRAAIQIEASIRRVLDNSRSRAPQAITQEAIDSRPRHQRPMGTIRELLWRAARS